MRNLKSPSIFLFIASVSVFCFARASGEAEDGTQKGLVMGFYDDKCPQAESVVRQAVRKNFRFNTGLPAGLLRLYFHDCFIRGCDASILLESTPAGTPVEQESPANGKTLVGIDVLEEAKQTLESKCPGTVSCADIIAFAARDAAHLAGLSRYNVPGGRRDGTVSNALDTMGLPFPSFDADKLTSMFAAKGFTQREMVVLLGAHSIGGAHCPTFQDRIYNATQNGEMDWVFKQILKARCPRVVGPMLSELGLESFNKVPFGLVARRRLDVTFYRMLLNGRALLASDQALIDNDATRAVVMEMAENPHTWAEEFAKAMAKIGALNVLVGDQGEVRTDCRFVNSQ